MTVLDRLVIQGVGISYKSGCCAASSSSSLSDKSKAEPSALGLSFMCLFQSYSSDFFRMSALTMPFTAMF